MLLDEKQRLSIKSVLREAGFEVSTAADRQVAVKLISEENPEFIILDRLAPEVDGIILCRNIRSEMKMPETSIIILGDSQDLPDTLLDPNIGADDYLFNPFEPAELLARIAALQRRQPERNSKQVLTAGAIEMVPDQWMVYVEGAPVKLTEKEYRLLQELLEVKGRVLTRDTLLERVWGHEKSFKLETRTLDAHMSRLRNKLGPSANSIITVRNVGYRINLVPEWFSPADRGFSR